MARVVIKRKSRGILEGIRVLLQSEGDEEGLEF